MTLLRTVVRQSARRAGRQLARNALAAERADARHKQRYGPVIDAQEPGMIGAVKAMSLSKFVLLCIVLGVSLLIVLPVLALIVLMFAEAINPGGG